MLNVWCLNNTFTKRLLPLATSYLKNEVKNQRIRSFNDTFNGIIEIKNYEIINNYSTFYQNDFFTGSLSIRENKYKYPFSGNYIPNEYCEVYSNIIIKNTLDTKTNFIKEKLIIKPHYPSPYHLHVNYYLKIDKELLVQKEEYGTLSSDTLNIIFTNNNKANNLMKKLEHYIKVYTTKIV